MTTQSKATEAVVLTLATYRATKLVIDDEITRELREEAYAQIDKIPNVTIRNKAAYLLGCPWCVSIYSAGFLLVLRHVAPKAYEFLIHLLAASAVTGILYEKV